MSARLSGDKSVHVGKVSEREQFGIVGKFEEDCASEMKGVVRVGCADVEEEGAG